MTTPYPAVRPISTLLSAGPSGGELNVVRQQRAVELSRVDALLHGRMHLLLRPQPTAPAERDLPPCSPDTVVAAHLVSLGKELERPPVPLQRLVAIRERIWRNDVFDVRRRQIVGDALRVEVHRVRQRRAVLLHPLECDVGETAFA